MPEAGDNLVEQLDHALEVGTVVRLRNDPGRRGVVLARVREQGSVRKRQVSFPEGVQYVPEDQLEHVEQGGDDPLDLLERGRLGDALDLRRTLTHARLTGRLANVIYSMDTTGTDFYPHQFKPVVKLLNSAGRGILIADEVGLGKTIEAGLLWTELRSRFDFRRLFVLCPAVLREKWQRELRLRFGVEADILDASAALLRLQRAAEEGRSGRFAIVASLQGLRPRRGWDEAERDDEGGPSSQLARFLERRSQEEPLVDLCVIDEAHYLRNPETMTAGLGRVLRAVSDYMILLSATPVHLKSGDLYQLLNLVDEDTFQRRQAFEDILEANRPLVRARELALARRAVPEELSGELERAAAHPLLQGNRQLEALLDEVRSAANLGDPGTAARLAERLDRVNLLGHAVTRTRKRDVEEWRVVREVVAQHIPLNPTEETFYQAVTDAVREYCMSREAHEGFLLVTPQRQMCSSMPAALRFWQEGGVSDPNELWEDLGHSGDDEEEGPLVQQLVARARQLGSLEELWRSDSKYEELRRRLRALFSDNPREKVVVFSYFRATLRYLHERLLEDGISNIVLHGGTPNKDDAIAEFRDAREGIALLSSEVGSEGIDLQFARIVINYDLPWNPMRVEQRIGRIDRLGQNEKKIHVWNLFYENTIDARIYRRLFERLKIFEGALGALDPVLGDKIQDLTRDLFSQHLTPEQEEARIEQTQVALENIRQFEEELEGEAAHLVAYGDYILNQVKAARDLHRTITARDIRAYVTDFFRIHYPGSELLQIGDDLDHFYVNLSTDARHELAQYLRQQRLDGTTQLTRNDVRKVRCRFENSAVPDLRGREEVISQFHPLVRFVGARIEELEEQRRPAVAIRLAAADIDRAVPLGRYAFSVQRWWVQGLRDMERLAYAAVSLADDRSSLEPDIAERLVVVAGSCGNDWPGARAALELPDLAATVSERCIGLLDAAFEEYVAELRRENEDRADVQERMLEQHHQNQRTKLEEVLDKHRQYGRAGLVRATEGRLRALETRVERRRKEIAERRELRQRNDDVCVGVIEVMS